MAWRLPCVRHPDLACLRLAPSPPTPRPRPSWDSHLALPFNTKLTLPFTGEQTQTGSGVLFSQLTRCFRPPPCPEPPHSLERCSLHGLAPPHPLLASWGGGAYGWSLGPQSPSRTSSGDAGRMTGFPSMRIHLPVCPGGFPCAPVQACTRTSLFHRPCPCRGRGLSPWPPLGSHRAPEDSGWGLGALGPDVGTPTALGPSTPGTEKGRNLWVRPMRGLLGPRGHQGAVTAVLSGS